MLKHRMLVLLFLSLLSTATFAGIISPGDAAVTGFSGVLAQPQNAIDFLNLDGPSLRVITLPGSVPYGLIQAPKRLTVTAREVGQVFGVTIDNASSPNIYVAATSAYGLAIYKAETGRVQLGEEDAQYVPGIFGPHELNAGATSIYKIDGASGKVTLFANVNYNGISNTPASLGALAFDPSSRQIYVSDRATGLIHRFGLDGTDRGIYDHGTQGLTAAGQAEIPFNPATIIDINNPSFDTKNPATWGFAPPGRRVYALAVYNHRIYYSVYGAQVWSVGIAQDGSFANDARFELQDTPIKEDSEISSITFDDRGLMYTAERGAPTGDYDFINVANGGTNRVKRFAPKTTDDGSPGLWMMPGDEYAIAHPPQFQNADGGVALNCKRIVWATAERLFDTGNNTDSFPKVDGLQGTLNELVKPANMPPDNSWYINYYDTEATPESRGHMGAIVILKVCGTQPTYVPPRYISPPVIVPPVIVPVCPDGTYYGNGTCIYRDCPYGFIRLQGRCIRPPLVCPYGTVYVRDRCIPICPPRTEFYNGHCRPPCPPHQRSYNGRCVPDCPPGQAYRNGYCKPDCPQGQVTYNGRCLPDCPRGQTYDNGHCKPGCPRGQTYDNGHCRPDCPRGQTYDNGYCRPKHCPPNQVLINGICVTKPIPPLSNPPKKPPISILCKTGYYYNGSRCVPNRIIKPNYPIKPIYPINPVKPINPNYKPLRPINPNYKPLKPINPNYKPLKPVNPNFRPPNYLKPGNTYKPVIRTPNQPVNTYKPTLYKQQNINKPSTTIYKLRQNQDGSQ